MIESILLKFLLPDFSLSFDLSYLNFYPQVLCPGWAWGPIVIDYRLSLYRK